ncbi:MAG: hypothetical protein RIR31_764 [Bacteroidota bacterium]
MSDYIPTKEGDKMPWNTNLDAKIAAQGAILGLSAADIADIKATAIGINAAINTSNTAQTAARAAKTNKDTIMEGGEKKLRGYIRSIKTNSKYTEAIGKDLQIIGEDPTFDPATYKPTIKTTVMPGRVVVSFVKEKLDGVNIYTRLKGQTTWQKLSFDSHSPYEDNRPLAIAGVPEHKEYMAIGVMQDEEVTLQSDIVEAVYGG